MALSIKEVKMIEFFGFLIAIWLAGWIIIRWIND